jgi:hypothetical protein
VISLTFAAASQFLPRLIPSRLDSALPVLTTEAYAMCLILALGGAIATFVDPSRARIWAGLLGCAPLVETLVRMVRSGAGNLWPIAIVLALALGLIPASLGAMVGRDLARRALGRMNDAD